jgi:hypothetical protein
LRTSSFVGELGRTVSTHENGARLWRASQIRIVKGKLLVKDPEALQ